LSGPPDQPKAPGSAGGYLPAYEPLLRTRSDRGLPRSCDWSLLDGVLDPGCVAACHRILHPTIISHSRDAAHGRLVDAQAARPEELQQAGGVGDDGVGQPPASEDPCERRDRVAAATARSADASGSRGTTNTRQGSAADSSPGRSGGIIGPRRGSRTLRSLERPPARAPVLPVGRT